MKAFQLYTDELNKEDTLLLYSEWVAIIIYIYLTPKQTRKSFLSSYLQEYINQSKTLPHRWKTSDFIQLCYLMYGTV